jgi:DNA invertase Pin-like site-specific DNA recombinase
MAKYVAYYRVSTATQGRSGLGLGAQKTRVFEFLSGADEIVAEHVEVQSGRTDNRTELWKAIATAKRLSAKVLIAKLDRFSRKVSFIAGIMEEGVGLVVADMPNATDFQLHIFAALAQEERRLISERTRSALAEAKRRGAVLGRNGAVLAVRHRQQAIERAHRLAPIVFPLIEQGQSYSAIARHLNALGIPTAKGGRFFPETAKKVVLRLRASMDDRHWKQV